MAKYQVWLRGSDLHDVEAESKEEALRFIRQWYGYKRLPVGTTVNEIPSDYYDPMVRNNQSIGIDITNM